MRRLWLLISLIAVPVLAEGPVYHHQDAAEQKEFDNAYQDIRSMKSGTWKPYTPNFLGFSSNPSVTARYAVIGKTCFYALVANSNGTSNSALFQVSLPFPSANNGVYYFGVGTGQDNGSPVANPFEVQVPPNSTGLNIYKDWTGSGWTSSGVKYASFSVVYEIQ